MEGKSNYSFDLLYEEAAQEDVFPEGTHQSVADELFKLIGRNQDGVTIGLEGGWGSGKSTVIEFLRQRCNSSDKDNYLFFVFDAWAHEGDPLRRIFLESLIEAIDPTENDEKLSHLKDKVSRRTKTIKTTSSQRASNLATGLTVSALFIPAGASFLSSIDYSSPSDQFWLLSTGIIFAFLPAIFLAFWYTTKKMRKEKIDWSLFSSNSVDKSTQDITEDEERTSIEFERFFTKIVQHATRADPTKKIIIVIDNLDRVETSHARNVWSTLQTFFQSRNATEEGKTTALNKTWVLIPYDRDALQKYISNSADEPKNRASTSDSFLSKSIQIRAEVPPAVFSGWTCYLDDCIQKAIGDWSEEDKQAVSRVYERHLSKLEQSPTPRQIRNFVNQVGFNGSRWGGKISIESIALYSIFKLEHSEVTLRAELISPKILDLSWLDNKENVRMELSGMLFGVKPEKGAELLLSPKIYKAIAEEDLETIKGLIETHNRAFWICWFSRQSTPEKTSHHNYIISYTLAFLECWKANPEGLITDHQSLKELWQTGMEIWDYSHSGYSKALDALYNLFGGDENFFSELSSKHTNALYLILEKIEDSDYSPKLIDAQKCQLWFETKGIETDTIEHAKLNAKNWIAWSSKLEKNHLHFSNIIPPSATVSELSENVFSKEDVPKSLANALLSCFRARPSDPAWRSAEEGVCTWLTNNQNAPPGNALSTFIILLSRKIGKMGHNPIRNSLSSQDYWSKLQDTSINDNTHQLAMSGIVFRSKIQESGNLPEALKSAWTDKDSPSLSKLGPIFLEMDNMKSLWDVSKDKRNLLAIQELKNPANDAFYQYKYPFEIFSDLYWVSKEEISKLVQLGSLKDFEKSALENPVYYSDSLLSMIRSSTPDLINLAEKSISEVDEGSWNEEFQNPHESSILTALIESSFHPDDRYSIALYNFLSAQIKGDPEHLWIWENLDQLIHKSLDRDKNWTALTSEYFSYPEDNLSEAGFSSVSKHLEKHVTEIDENRILDRVLLWANQEMWARIDWFIDLGLSIDIALAPETLIKKVSRMAKEEDNSTISRLADLLQINLDSADKGKE